MQTPPYFFAAILTNAAGILRHCLFSRSLVSIPQQQGICQMNLLYIFRFHLPTDSDLKQISVHIHGERASLCFGEALGDRKTKS